MDIGNDGWILRRIWELMMEKVVLGNTIFSFFKERIIYFRPLMVFSWSRYNIFIL